MKGIGAEFLFKITCASGIIFQADMEIMENP